MYYNSDSPRIIFSDDYPCCSVALKYYPLKNEYILSYSDYRDINNNFFFIEFSNARAAYYLLCAYLEQDSFTPAIDLDSYKSVISFLKL